MKLPCLSPRYIVEPFVSDRLQNSARVKHKLASLATFHVRTFRFRFDPTRLSCQLSAKKEKNRKKVCEFVGRNNTSTAVNKQHSPGSHPSADCSSHIPPPTAWKRYPPAGPKPWPAEVPPNIQVRYSDPSLPKR